MISPVRPVAAVLAVLLVALPGAARAADQPPGAESPEALVARMQAAVESQDLPEMMACVAPRSRREMALALVAGTGIMVAFLGMGGEMAGAMGEALGEEMAGERTAGEEPTPEQEAEAAAQKAEVEKEQAALEAKAAEMQRRFEAILERHGVTEMMKDESPLPEEPEARAAALEKLFADTDDIALMVDLMGLMDDLGDSSEEREIPSPVPVSDAVTDYQVGGDRATAKAGDETLEFVRVDGRWYFEPGDALPAAPPPAP